MVAKHHYAVQLIRKQVDPVRRTGEAVALEKVCASFAEACAYALKYGALKGGKRPPSPRIDGARAVYPCADKRFSRVQIVIRPI